MEGILMLIIVLAFLKIFLCQNDNGVCAFLSKEITCCPDYYNANGTCILCPKGSYGNECQKPCPGGLYGAGCRMTCNCEKDQMCNTIEGCVANVTINSSTFRLNTSIEQTTVQELLTTQLHLENKTFLWLYVTMMYLASAAFIVALCSICFLVGNCFRRKRTRNDREHVADIRAPVAGPEVATQMAIVDNTVYGSDYTEICDIEAANRDSSELSTVYHEPSF